MAENLQKNVNILKMKNSLLVPTLILKTVGYQEQKRSSADQEFRVMCFFLLQMFITCKLFCPLC